MKMMEIQDYTPQPGELVEFKIAGPARSATAAGSAHPAPPSQLQENHIRRNLANQAAGRPQSHWIGVAFDMPGKLDTAALVKALTRWVRRHPTLLTWFTLDDDRLHRHAVPPETVTLEPVNSGSYDSSTALRDALMTRLASGTDAMRWPSFVAGAVLRGEGQASTVWLGIEHSHSDGYSVALVFSELRALYEAEAAGTEVCLPATGSYVDYCVLDRERAALVTADAPGVRRWVDFYRAGSAPEFPLDLGMEPGVFYPGVTIEMDVFDTEQAHAFAQECKRHGAGFTAGLHAAMGITGDDLSGRSDYRGLSVVHTRTERRWQYTQGWFVNLVPIECSAADGFGKAAIGTQQALTAVADLTGITPMKVMELAPDLATTIQSETAAAYPTVSYIDCRHIPGSHDWAAANCTGLEGPRSSRQVLLWVNRLWDRTYLKAHYPNTPVARQNVPRVLTHLRRVLRTVAQTGERPSV
ncbi:condensation domain-containing protein [Streptomyces sp. NPDC056149]|uniref:condensation domain-containing protein n=1 Tax=Streptomyces sp. NPDC056149 TaxID=3345728 RepID=UPI0035E28C2D